MTPSPDDLDPLAGLPPGGDPQQDEQRRTVGDAATQGVGDVVAGGVEATGQILGAAAEAGGAMVEAAGTAAGALAEGAGAAVGGLADGCSCSLVVLLGVALSAGTALAAQLIR